ncbi:MAG: helix-turn-helix domain-containing protein [Anaerolineae bacterium]
MKPKRAWVAYSPAYRAKEMKTLAGWIQAGQSGAVVGLGGAGKSNLLGFLSHRPDALHRYLPEPAGPVVVVPVDLNNLPTHNLSVIYRVILRAFYETRERFDTPLRKAANRLYLDNRAAQDPFLSLSALRELLLLCHKRQTRVVLVLDRFDGDAMPAITNTLRGLRDSFKDSLSFIVGSRRPMAELGETAALGELREVLDTHVCWVGPMAEADARQVIAQETATASPPPSPADVTHILILTGGYPALLKAVCHWWLSTPTRPDPAAWPGVLLAGRSLQYRLAEIWDGLSPDEQFALSELQKLQPTATRKTFEGLQKRHAGVLTRLVIKGICVPTGNGWRIFGTLFKAYIAQKAGRGSRAIWLDERSGVFYRGQTQLTGLTPLEETLLQFLVKNPRERHTKSTLIDNVWPDDEARDGIMDDSLFQAISSLRKKIEPNPAKPCYILTWRGKPEGGYQFFPEGRPP